MSFITQSVEIEEYMRHNIQVMIIQWKFSPNMVIVILTPTMYRFNRHIFKVT